MAILDTIGGTVLTNEQSTITGYIVVDEDPGEADVDSEDVDSANGARFARHIFKRDDKLSLNLIPTTGTPTTDFPIHDMCILTGYTAYYVNSRSIVKSRGATRVKVDMTNIGIT